MWSFGVLPLIIYCLLSSQFVWGMNRKMKSPSAEETNISNVPSGENTGRDKKPFRRAQRAYYNFDPNFDVINQTTRKIFMEYIKFLKSAGRYNDFKHTKEFKWFQEQLVFLENSSHEEWYNQYRAFLRKIHLPFPGQHRRDPKEVLTVILNALSSAKISVMSYKELANKRSFPPLGQPERPIEPWDILAAAICCIREVSKQEVPLWATTKQGTLDQWLASSSRVILDNAFRSEGELIKIFPESIKHIIEFYITQILFRLFGLCHWFEKLEKMPQTEFHEITAHTSTKGLEELLSRLPLRKGLKTEPPKIEELSSRQRASSSSTANLSIAPQEPNNVVFLSRGNGANIAAELFKLLAKAEKRVWMAVYRITDGDICQAIASAKNNNLDLDIKVIVDKDSLKSRNNPCFTADFLAHPWHGVGVYVFEGQALSTEDTEESEEPAVRPLMHDKYIIFDDDILWNGSYNFTWHAKMHNRESVTVAKDKEAAGDAARDFCSILNDDNVVALANYRFVEEIHAARSSFFLYTSEVTNPKIIEAIKVIIEKPNEIRVLIYIWSEEKVSQLKEQLGLLKTATISSCAPPAQQTSYALIDEASFFYGTSDCMSNSSRLDQRDPERVAREGVVLLTKTLFAKLQKQGCPI
jgi:hypothetical protein